MNDPKLMCQSKRLSPWDRLTHFNLLVSSSLNPAQVKQKVLCNKNEQGRTILEILLCFYFMLYPLKVSYLIDYLANKSYVLLSLLNEIIIYQK